MSGQDGTGEPVAIEIDPQGRQKESCWLLVALKSKCLGPDYHCSCRTFYFVRR